MQIEIPFLLCKTGTCKVKYNFAGHLTLVDSIRSALSGWVCQQLAHMWRMKCAGPHVSDTYTKRTEKLTCWLMLYTFG